MTAIAWAIIIIIATGASLLFLLKRPNLSGDQKLVALLIFMVVGVPVGGLLFLVLAVAAIMVFWEAVAADSLAFLFITAPLAVLLGLLLVLIASVADEREARKAAAATPEMEVRHAEADTKSSSLTGAELRGWVMAVAGFLLVVGVPLLGYILHSNFGLDSGGPHCANARSVGRLGRDGLHSLVQPPDARQVTYRPSSRCGV